MLTPKKFIKIIEQMLLSFSENRKAKSIYLNESTELFLNQSDKTYSGTGEFKCKINITGL